MEILEPDFHFGVESGTHGKMTGAMLDRIDIMMNISGFQFSSAWKNRARSSYGGERVYVVGLDDLIQAKRTINREQDRLDLKILEKPKTEEK